MAKYIDIKDFDGTLTNADIEDLPENVAQEIKNLKIQAGKLEKTFGAGTPSGVPAIGLSFVNTKTGTTNTVYNIFTFISDKLDGATVNDAGDQYRYLLVTIDNARNTKLWWYDFGAPNVTDHLQIENDIVWFQTASAHGFVEDDYVLVQDCKHNTSPLTDITSAGVYDQVDHVPTDTTLGVNTDNATSWGGSFFDTSVSSGFTAMPFGGKVATHKIVDDTVAFGGTNWGNVDDIAIEIDTEATTADGLFTLREVECLGACSNAPMVQLNDDFYENLSAETTIQLLDACAAGKPPKLTKWGSLPMNGRVSCEGPQGKTSLHTVPDFKTLIRKEYTKSFFCSKYRNFRHA